MPCSRVIFGAILVMAVSVPPADAAGSARRGKPMFAPCAVCHSFDAQGDQAFGPHLAGLFGRPAASVEGFPYSRSLRQSGIVWDEQTLRAYLFNPRDLVPMGKMPYAGLKAERPERAMDHLMAYILKEIGG